MGLDSFIAVQSNGQFGWEVFTLIDENQVGYIVASPKDQGFLEFNVDLAGLEKPVLEFDYAYHNGFEPGDSLAVEVLNCTTNQYTTVFFKGGDDLHTIETQSHPTKENDWGCASISLEEYKDQKTKIKFRCLSDEWGYFAIFLDNVRVREDKATSVIDGAAQYANVKIIPNPVSDHLVIETSKTFDAYYISDVNGKTIQDGKGSKDIDVSELSQGVYLVTLVFHGTPVTKRFIKL